MRPDDGTGEMGRRSLDRQTADGLLSGRIVPDDAPAGLAGVARLLQAARAEVGAADPARQAATVAAMAAAHAGSEAAQLVTNPSRRSTVFRRLRTPKVAVLALAGAVSLAGVAAAATGAISADNNAGGNAASTHGACVSDAVHDVKTSTSEPRGEAVSDAAHSCKKHSNEGHGKDAVADLHGSKNDNDKGGNSANTHGECVSAVAHATSTTRVADSHGDAVSAAAESCPTPEPNGPKTAATNTVGSTTTTRVSHGATVSDQHSDSTPHGPPSGIPPKH